MKAFSKELLAGVTTDDREYLAKLMGEYGLEFVESLPWGTIGEELGKGAIGYIGGELFKKAFGIPTLENVVNRATVELKDFIRTQFETGFLTECNSRVASLYDMLIEYHNSPETSEHRLNYIDTQSNDLMRLLQGRSVDAFYIYVLASILKIVALYTRYERYKAPGELENIKRIIGSTVVSVSMAVKDLEAHIQQRVSDVYEVSTGEYTNGWTRGDPKVHRDPEPILWWHAKYAFTVNNNVSQFDGKHYDKQKAQNIASELANAARNVILSTVRQRMQDARALIFVPSSSIQVDLLTIKMKIAGS